MKTDAIRKCIETENIVNSIAAQGSVAAVELTAIETALAAKDEALRMAARLMEQGQYMCLDDDAILDVQEKVGTALSPPTEPKECQWLISELREEGDIWQTDCGHEFVLNEGTPSYNGAKFCPYCGKKLVERVVEENDA